MQVRRRFSGLVCVDISGVGGPNLHHCHCCQTKRVWPRFSDRKLRFSYIHAYCLPVGSGSGVPDERSSAPVRFAVEVPPLSQSVVLSVAFSRVMFCFPRRSHPHHVCTSFNAASGASSFVLSALCVSVHHQVNGRIISKQIHVRVEHVSPSKCRDEMKRRVKENEAAKKAVREGGGQSMASLLSLLLKLPSFVYL